MRFLRFDCKTGVEGNRKTHFFPHIKFLVQSAKSDAIFNFQIKRIDALLKSMQTYKTFRSLILCFNNNYLLGFLRSEEIHLNDAHCCTLTQLVVIGNRFHDKNVIHERYSFSACMTNALDY